MLGFCEALVRNKDGEASGRVPTTSFLDLKRKRVDVKMIYKTLP